MAIPTLSVPDLFNCFTQSGHLIYEINIDVYTFVDEKSRSFATFDFKHNICALYNEPGVLFRFNSKDFEYALKDHQTHIYTIESLNDNSNSLEPNYQCNEKGEIHPANKETKKFFNLTDWILLENGDAVRYYIHSNTNLYGSRAAYVSKSARIRIKDNQWLTVSGRSSDYGLCLENLLACDEELIKLGYHIK